MTHPHKDNPESFWERMETIHGPLTWRCHICGEERPDAKISVHTHLTEIPNTGGAKVTTNVRHCNDRPACCEQAPTFNFFKDYEP